VGDLCLKTHFLVHSVFRVDDADVSLELPVVPFEAALARWSAVLRPTSVRGVGFTHKTRCKPS
jgi:hypothetical protein